MMSIMLVENIRPVAWLGDSRKQVRSFPPEVRKSIGTALYDAQKGDKAPTAMTRKRQPEYEIGSGNVFADLELDDADELLTRAQLGHTVRLILKARKLKQREIAK